jgi:uncharacterized protein YbjT (DUF2867 family)
MHQTTAILLGASGLIGNFLLRFLLEKKEYNKVIVIGRKLLDIEHPKLEQRIIDFGNLTEFENAITQATTLFCCIGTTMKTVKGNKQLYKSIDFDIPVNAAKFAFLKGITAFHLVSAIGADSKSNIFYNKLKGEVEEAIQQYRFTSIHIYQPGLLLGKRSEFRLGEWIAQKMIPIFHFLLIGSWRKYKAIKASDVALAMYYKSVEEKKGVHVHTYNSMKEASI